MVPLIKRWELWERHPLMHKLIISRILDVMRYHKTTEITNVCTIKKINIFSQKIHNFNYRLGILYCADNFIFCYIKSKWIIYIYVKYFNAYILARYILFQSMIHVFQSLKVVF